MQTSRREKVICIVKPVKGNLLVKFDSAWQNLLFRFIGTHHSARDLQPYINEYAYRYNRHNKKDGIFANLIYRMMVKPPYPYKPII